MGCRGRRRGSATGARDSGRPWSSIIEVDFPDSGLNGGSIVTGDRLGEVPFREHVELLQSFLAHRDEIVGSIESLLNAQRKPSQYLQDGPLLSVSSKIVSSHSLRSPPASPVLEVN